MAPCAVALAALLIGSCAASETFIYQDLSATAASLYQGSETADLSIVGNRLYTCGHTAERTCGYTPSGCSTFERTASTASSTQCSKRDVVVTSHDLDGALQWMSMAGGKDSDSCSSVSATSTTVVVTGITGPKNGIPGAGALLGGVDSFVLALDKTTGKQLWSKHVGTTSYDRASSVETYGGEVYALGYTEAIEDRYGYTQNVGHCHLAKLSLADGSIAWSSNFGGDTDDTCTATTMAQDLNGGVIYVVGKSSEGYVVGTGTILPTVEGQKGKGGSDALIVKILRATGKVLWARLLGGAKNEGMLAVTSSSDAKYVFAAGYTTLPSGSLAGYVAKVTMDGTTAWTRTFPQITMFRNIQFTYGTLFVSGTTAKATMYNNVKHSKVSDGTDTAILQLDSSTGSLKSDSVGSQIGIKKDKLTSFQSTGLAVVAQSGGIKTVYVSGTGMDSRNGIQGQTFKTGMLFALAPNPSSASDFTSAGAKFGNSDVISLVPGTDNTISLSSSTSSTGQIPVLTLDELAVGESSKLTVLLQRGNAKSRQWCSDATVATAVKAYAVRLGSTGDVATEIATSVEGLITVTAPSSVTFNTWATKRSFPSTTKFASVEDAEISVTIKNNKLGDARESFVSRMLVIISLTGPCKSSTTHMNGCTITNELGSSSSASIAILVKAKNAFEIDENKENKGTETLAIGLGVGAGVLCLCLCCRYVVRPYRQISEDRQQIQDDIYADIQSSIKTMQRIPSFMRDSPRSAFRAIQHSPSPAVATRNLIHGIKHAPSHLASGIRNSPTVFSRGIQPNRNNRVQPEVPAPNNLDKFARQNSTKQQQQEIDRRIGRLKHAASRDSPISLVRSFSRNILTFKNSSSNLLGLVNGPSGGRSGRSRPPVRQQTLPARLKPHKSQGAAGGTSGNLGGTGGSIAGSRLAGPGVKIER